MSKNIVTVYSCGGCGANILKKMPTVSGEGMAKMVPYYIDTSLSNLRSAQVPAESVFLFEGLDGSGKVRAENHEVIAKSTLKILQTFKPGNFSIVLHSASGGSGAVIGASLVSELKKRGDQVVVIVIGSTGSEIEIENTLKSLKTYDMIAYKNESPVVTHYLENSTTSGRQKIDGAATTAILALLALFSGLNDELDTADLRNWMKHTKLGNELVSLHFCTSAADYAAAGTVVTVATLAKPEHNTNVSPVPAYQTVGYVTNADANAFLGSEPLHFTISSDLITPTAKGLTSKLKEVAAHLSSTVRRESLVNRNDTQTDSGLIL